MAEVVFNYDGREIKIPCDISDKMEDIIKRFLIKVQKDGEILPLVYLYNGSTNIKSELKFSEQANKLDRERKKMNIIVTKDAEVPIINKNPIKDIICPNCKENILIEISNFKITLYNCKNNHEIKNILLTEFEETQKIDLSKIICDICKKNNKKTATKNEFYFCNKCNKNICILCKSVHDPSHTIINYDDKNYLCKKHNDPFTKYCKICFENICIMCENKHNGHELFELGKILIDKDDLLELIEKLKNTIDKFKLKINSKDILNKVENQLNIYYKINNDFISNYNMNKRNFHKLTNLNFLKKYNEKIIKDFNNMINSNNIFELYDFILVNFYNSNENYIGEMKNGLWEGKGLLYFQKNDELNRKKYEGEFKNGKMEGKGIMYYINGARYEGEFKNDYREGKGIVYYNNGNKYEGEFKNDKKIEQEKNNFINKDKENINKDIKTNTPDKQKEINKKYYDVIVLGTGLKQLILATLLAKYPENIAKDEKKGIKILQLDRNNYIGSESASLNLTNLWKHFFREEEVPEYYGLDKDWNVDLIPKFIMASGTLVKIILKTKASQYIEWKSIDGIFMYKFSKGGWFSKAGVELHKTPDSGYLEKGSLRKFMNFIQGYESNNPKTQNGLSPYFSFKDFVKKYSLEPNIIDFIGHATALYTNDDFLFKKAIVTINKIQTYMNSWGRYGNSPFIYPVFGLGEISEGFSKIYSSCGGCSELNRDIEEILFDQNGKFKGIKSKGEIIYGKILITEPSYVKKLGYVKASHKIFRRICILNHSIPNTKDIDSCLIIIPQIQINRKNDILISVLNHINCVCKKGYYLAIISTIVETDNPRAEIEPAMQVIGPYIEKFDEVIEFLQPIYTAFKDNIYITSSFDFNCNFENDMDDVLDIYKKITGKDLDLNLEEDE